MFIVNAIPKHITNLLMSGFMTTLSIVLLQLLVYKCLYLTFATLLEPPSCTYKKMTFRKKIMLSLPLSLKEIFFFEYPTQNHIIELEFPFPRLGYFPQRYFFSSSFKQLLPSSNDDLQTMHLHCNIIHYYFFLNILYLHNLV